MATGKGDGHPSRFAPDSRRREPPWESGELLLPTAARPLLTAAEPQADHPTGELSPAAPRLPLQPRGRRHTPSSARRRRARQQRPPRPRAQLQTRREYRSQSREKVGDRRDGGVWGVRALVSARWRRGGPWRVGRPLAGRARRAPRRHLPLGRAVREKAAAGLASAAASSASWGALAAGAAVSKQAGCQPCCG